MDLSPPVSTNLKLISYSLCLTGQPGWLQHKAERFHRISSELVQLHQHPLKQSLRGQVHKHCGTICCCLGLLRRVHRACSGQAHAAKDGATMRVYPAPEVRNHACRQPVVSCFCHWRLSEDQNIEHYINSRVNCNSKLIINMKSKIQNQCLVKFSLMQVILTNFPHKILRCMSTSIDRLPTGVFRRRTTLISRIVSITVPSLARENNNSAPARTAASGADIYCI